MSTKFLLFSIVALLVGTTVRAYDFTAGGIYYNITDATAKTVEVTYKVQWQVSYSGVVIIPSQVTNGSDTYSVTKIGDNAFVFCTNVTSVTITNSMTNIGNAAFAGCGFTSFTIPSSVINVGNNAFYSCSKLSDVYILSQIPPTCASNAFTAIFQPNSLHVPVGTKAAYQAATGWSSFSTIKDDVTTTFASVKALLKGPLSGTTMSTTLNTAGLIPKAQPYSGTPWDYPGTESVTAIPANVTDWVLVELRDATTPATVVATRAAFIKSDGLIVDTDGTSPVEFKNVAPGNYHLAVKHRNHLAIRTATAQALGGTSAGAAPYDFTTAQAQASGPNGMVLSGSVFAMWSGDANADGNVYNTATPQDASLVVNAVANRAGNALRLPSYTGYRNVYNALDLNMDGNVYNTASPQDVSTIVNNVANYPQNALRLPSYTGLKAK